MTTKELNSLPCPTVNSSNSRGKKILKDINPLEEKKSSKISSPKQRKPTQAEFQNIKYIKLWFPNASLL